MTALIVKFGQTIGEMYGNVPSMRVGEKLYLDGQSWEVNSVMHFLDAGKGIKEYNIFTKPFTRYVIKPINQ